jgi:diguanylate cyclase (GGDEF)-like protein/PAS domain S-box-containing protein
MLLTDFSGVDVSLEQILDRIRVFILQIHQSLDLSEILSVTVQEVREVLESDRAIIYRFLPDGDGVIAEESVNPEWQPILGQLIYDPCFNAKWIHQYQQGQIGILEDIDAQPLQPCYKNLLTSLQIRAKLVIPILVSRQKPQENTIASSEIWGLLIVHQCSSPRHWQALEIKFLQLITAQLGIALQQLEMQQQFRQKNKSLEREQVILQAHQVIEKELRGQEALLRSMTDSSQLGFYVVNNRNDEILYFNHRFCEIWGIEHLAEKIEQGEIKNNDIIPDCVRLIADVPAFAESCKPLQSEENRSTIEDEILFVDGRTIRRFSSQVRDIYDRYFGRLYIFEDISDRIQAEAALRESEERYRSLITTMAEGIVLQQANRTITACNESAERILGLTADQMMGRTSIDPQWQAVNEDGSPFPGETHPAMVTLRTGEPQFNIIMGIYKPDGSLSWISINSQPLFHQNQTKPYAVVTSFADITIRKQIEETLTQQAERERMIYAIAQRIRQSLNLEQILNTTVDEVRHFLQTDRVIIYRFNPDWSGVVVKESASEGWLKIINMEITDTYFVEKKGQSYSCNTTKATSDIYQSGFAPCHIELLEKLQVRAKLVVPILQGDNLWGLLVAHHCSSPRQWYPWQSELLQQLATQVAIAIQQSELHEQLQIANKQLENLVLVDQLTQIANRRCFDRTINQEWIRAIREQHPLSLLICDIDCFKQYNDTYGHIAGDICLKFVAQSLKQAIQRSTDLVARYGGEEFAIILPNTNSNGAVEVAQKIYQVIQEKNISHTASDVSEFITISMGIATIIPTGKTVTLNLIEAADRALYQAKSNGRNRFFVENIA